MQIQKGANEGQTLKSLEFVSQSLYLEDARGEIKRLLVKRATVCVSTCLRHSHMLKTQHLKWLRKCPDQFGMVQDIALISARRQQAECMILFWRPLVSKHIQALSHPH